MSESFPLVSIYMPTRNRCELMEAAIVSAVNQSYQNLEILVVDDGSTDETPVKVKALSSKYPAIRFFRNDISLGACHARNIAIRASTGAFLTGLDDDDEFLPNHISSLVSQWDFYTKQKMQPACLFVEYLYRDGNRMFEGGKRGHVVCDDLFDANHVGNQVFAPRKNYIESGLFDEDMPAWQDLEFYFRMLERFGPARLVDTPSYIFDITYRPDRISGQQKKKILIACDLMFAKNGRGDPRIHQRLLLQAFSSYYGFDVSTRDLLYFYRLGWWRRGYILMFMKWIGRPIDEWR